MSPDRLSARLDRIMDDLRCVGCEDCDGDIGHVADEVREQRLEIEMDLIRGEVAA